MSAFIHYETPGTSLADVLKDVATGSRFGRVAGNCGKVNFPRVDIVEDKDAYRILADLPGLDKKDIKIEVDSNVLSISGEKTPEKKEQEKDRYYHFERTYGSFSRKFQLPENVVAENIEAKFTNGVLELTLKKIEETKPKAIEVKIA